LVQGVRGAAGYAAHGGPGVAGAGFGLALDAPAGPDGGVPGLMSFMRSRCLEVG
jgi:hypothetical protein